MSKVKAIVKHVGGRAIKDGEGGGRFEAKPGEAKLTLDLVNDGDEAIAIDLEVAQLPSLCLEVEDSAGHRVLLPPPSVLRPGREGIWVTLAPKHAQEIQVAGLPLPWWPSGDYRARYRYKGHKDSRTPAGTRRAEDFVGDWVTISHTREEIEQPEQPVGDGGFRYRPGPQGGEGGGGGRQHATVFDCIAEILRQLCCGCGHRHGHGCGCGCGCGDGKAAYTGGGAPSPPNRCKLVSSREVDVAINQTITDATDPAWNGSYAWNARFKVTVDQNVSRVTVAVRIMTNGAVTAAQKLAWEGAIEQKWGNLFKFCCSGGNYATCCPYGYTYVFDVQWVTSNYHYVVTAGASTANMNNWGVNDTVDVTHEFGHMLGNVDEYFTVNGVPYGPGRQPDGNIMNNPANLPIARHYDLILSNLMGCMGGGTTGTTRAVGESCA